MFANVGFGCPERKGPFHPFAEFAGVSPGNAEHVRWDARISGQGRYSMALPEMVASTAECAAQSFAARRRHGAAWPRVRGLPSGECAAAPGLSEAAAIAGVAEARASAQRGGTRREGMPELIKRLIAATPAGVCRRKLALKVHTSWRFLGQVVLGQGAAPALYQTCSAVDAALYAAFQQAIRSRSSRGPR